MRVARFHKHSLALGAAGLGVLFADDPSDGGGGGGDKPDDKPGDKPEGKPGDKPADKPGDGGKPDEWRGKYDGQLKVNRDLEEKLNTLRDGLKSALGVEDKKADAADLVGQLQQQLDALTHTNTVNDVARRHGITDTEDLDILRATKDAAVMEKLAERLSRNGDGAGGSSKPGKPGTPRPDPSQGKGGGSEGARPKSVAEVMAERRAAREAKKTA